MNKEIIPIFFAVDDNYIPYLGIVLQSLIDNSSEKYLYEIKVLSNNIKRKNKEKIKNFEKENVNIEFVDISKSINKIKNQLCIRDYFSQATYYRLFIPELYPQYDKAIYLDSDIIILSDIANLYSIDIDDDLLGAAPDGIMGSIDVFKEYAEKVVGVRSYKNYFNAGVLIMNLKELRKYGLLDKFLYLLDTIKFAVAQDQDYLNRLCKGRVTMISDTWNRMPIIKEVLNRDKLNIIHYNMANKPWRSKDVLYNEYFWEYAKKTEFYEELLRVRDSYTDKDTAKDALVIENLARLAQFECDCVGDDRDSNKKKKQNWFTNTIKWRYYEARRNRKK